MMSNVRSDLDFVVPHADQLSLKGSSIQDCDHHTTTSCSIVPQFSMYLSLKACFGCIEVQSGPCCWHGGSTGSVHL